MSIHQRTPLLPKSQENVISTDPQNPKNGETSKEAPKDQTFSIPKTSETHHKNGEIIIDFPDSPLHRRIGQNFSLKIQSLCLGVAIILLVLGIFQFLFLYGYDADDLKIFQSLPLRLLLVAIALLLGFGSSLVLNYRMKLKNVVTNWCCCD